MSLSNRVQQGRCQWYYWIYSFVILQLFTPNLSTKGRSCRRFSLASRLFLHFLVFLDFVHLSNVTSAVHFVPLTTDSVVDGQTSSIQIFRLLIENSMAVLVFGSLSKNRRISIQRQKLEKSMIFVQSMALNSNWRFKGMAIHLPIVAFIQCLSLFTFRMRKFAHAKALNFVKCDRRENVFGITNNETNIRFWPKYRPWILFRSRQ